MSRFKTIICIQYIAVIVLFSSCKMTPQKFMDETPTRGNTKIAVDESYQLLAEAELYTFLSLYKDANIKSYYLPEDSLLKLFRSTDHYHSIITWRRKRP